MKDELLVFCRNCRYIKLEEKEFKKEDAMYFAECSHPKSLNREETKYLDLVSGEEKIKEPIYRSCSNMRYGALEICGEVGKLYEPMDEMERKIFHVEKKLDKVEV